MKKRTNNRNKLNLTRQTVRRLLSDKELVRVGGGNDLEMQQAATNSFYYTAC